jgi:hypothetical protein
MIYVPTVWDCTRWHFFFLWFFSKFWERKYLLHRPQLNIFSPVCTRRCSFFIPFVLKDLLQRWHLYEPTFIWILECAFNATRPVKLFVQLPHWKVLCTLWLYWCSLKMDEFAYTFPQTSHRKEEHCLIWHDLCFFRSNKNLNDSLQSPHLNQCMSRIWSSRFVTEAKPSLHNLQKHSPPTTCCRHVCSR